MLYNSYTYKLGGWAVYCIKCGRELRGEQVFCRECQEEMENYPVKPGTLVHLPVRMPSGEEKPKSSRIAKNLPPEIRLRRMRTTVRLLTLALIALFFAFSLTALLTLHLLNQRDQQNRIGQNYHVIFEE